MQIFPIIAALSYFFYPCDFEMLSGTILGKCIVVSLIIFYTYQEMMYGLVVCMMAVLFYEFALPCYKPFQESFLSESGKQYADHLPKPALKHSSPGFEDHSCDFELNRVQEIQTPLEGQSIFRKEQCATNHVMHKGLVVKNAYLPHLFPGFEFSGAQCNPCEEKCLFSVQEKKLEDEIVSIDSRNTFDRIKDMFL